MTEPTPNPLPLTNAICMHCGYDLTGTYTNELGQITCPECGVRLQRSQRQILTRALMQRSLRRKIIYPLGGWSALTLMIAMPAPNTGIALIVFLIYSLAYPIALLMVFPSVWSSLHAKLKPHPRPYPVWSAPLWALLYCTITAAMYLLMFMTMIRFW